MIYATSDLHGTSLEDFKKLLNKAGFGKNVDDFLFILGDVVDRQNDGGIEILKWLLEQPNAQIILGNHEAALLSCDFVFEEITNESINNFTQEKMQLLNNYIQNGGDVTLKALRSLMQTEPDTVCDILDYLRDAPLYETVSIGDGKDFSQDFLLVHSGLENFSPNKDIKDYAPDELLWARPDIKQEYFHDLKTVFGHTPTVYYGGEYKGKILRTKTWVDIDTSDTTPTVLCLDTMQEFRLED